MGSIPLPALAARAPEQPDPLSQIGKVIALKNLMQQSQYEDQARPLQLQQAQAQNQITQQGLSDQKAGLAAMQEWDGRDYDALGRLIAKNGGSLSAVNQAQQAGLAIREKYSTIAKNDAETGAKQIDTLKEKNNLLAGRLNALADVPDAQLPQSILQSAQDALGSGLIDQQHMQQVTALSQMPPAQARQALAIFEKTLKGNTQQLEDAQKTASTQKTQAEIPGVQAESTTKQANIAAMNTWLAAHPGKTAADYEVSQAGRKAGAEAGARLGAQESLEKYKYGLQMGAGAGGGSVELSPAQNATAQAILEGRMSPPGGFALKAPYWQAVMGQVFSKDPQFNEQRAQLRKDFTVGKHSNEINAINTAMGHVGVLGDAVDALNNGDIKRLNQIANFLGVETGSDNKTTFQTIVNRVGPEISSAYLASGGSAGERGANAKDFDPSLSPQQLKSNISITAKLLRSKIGSLENQWDQNAAPGVQSFQDRFITAEAKKQLDKWAPQKSGGGVTVTDPAGGVHTFPNQKSADAFKAAAGIQ
jgi:hypothetical protein